MAHTPGPWLAKKGVGWIVYRPDAEARKEAAIMVGMSPAVSLVCDPAAKWFEDGEAEANAHLISAAPEMLRSLKELLPMLVEWGKNPIYYTQAESNIIGFAEDAIAKAEGRQ